MGRLPNDVRTHFMTSEATETTLLPKLLLLDDRNTDLVEDQERSSATSFTVNSKRL